MIGLLWAQVSESQDILRTGGPVALLAFVIVAAAVAGKLHFNTEVDGLRNDKARLEAQVDALTHINETVVIPTVHDAIAAMRDTVRVAETAVAAQARTEAALARIESRT